MKKFTILVAVAMVSVASAQMKHTEGMHEAGAGTLTEAGTDVFATLQEAIVQLEANPDTDWEKVNVEALRSHLLEMVDMSVNVAVVETPLANGFQARVKPITERAEDSLRKVLSAHPQQLEAETGWDMQVSDADGEFTITVTTANDQEIARIKALGYIGVMARGDHHKPHHWAILSGNNPHDGNFFKNLLN